MSVTRRAFLLVPAVLLSACAMLQPPAPAGLPAESAAYVLLGEDGTAVVRAIVPASACPSLLADGRELAMRVRAPAETVPQRPTASRAEESKPSSFPVLTCEAVLPSGVRAASVGGRDLPLPKPAAARIVVVGDTGCRLKNSDDRTKPGTWQDCNDPASFPFAEVARAAAAWKPDLVIHVGDYHYRENACPADRPGCAGNSWGYGWDTWRDDFFKPAAPLLAQAPWIVVRGNHETCKRAGQGWWRFLDPRPLLPGRDCNDPAKDAVGDFSEPYAVPLDTGTQVLVADTGNTPNLALPPEDPRALAYRSDYARLEQLARRTPHNIALTHHPLLGFFPRKEADGRVTLQPGNAGILSVWGPLSPLVLPANVQVLLSGHTHLWQQVSFSTPHASQFIVGFSGTDPDDVPIPARVPPGAMPAPGAVAERLSSWVGGFGFMTMEKHSAGRWQVGVHDRTGKRVNFCLVDGTKSVCDQAVVPRTP